ncbi:MAG TPA: sensor histidine kinase KdpD [Kofleriaceae bacterium]
MASRDPERPDPDALLARVQRNAARDARARLKVFFGAAPGVGKTYAMLEAARRSKADGASILIGAVETHGRTETARLLDGLDVLPRRRMDHRGVVLEEFDLEAALARKPGFVVVDELAHTNAPGSRHAKRWQDVVELLDAGIDVWTTLNVQHVESLGDVVQQITGIKVRETVPDAMLERADDIELVDLSPEDLLARLAEGKVYVPDQASRALLFQRGNLLALRELALRRAAEHVDAEVLRYRREHGIATPWPTHERIVVCVGPSPGSERLIRATKRMAEGLHAPWIAVNVELIGAAPLGPRDRERLEAHLRLVETLGGDVVRLRGHRVAEALLAHAREHNVTRIVAGKPTHPRWRDRLRGSMLDDLIRGSGPIEVHVIAPVVSGAAQAEPMPRAEHAELGSYAWAIAAIAGVTAIGLFAFEYVALAEITMLYLIAILLASLLGRGPSLVAVALAVVLFNFCFVPPRFTLAVADVRHLLTFGVMFGSGLVISTLVIRLRRQERDAITREQRTAHLQAFTRDVAAADSVADVATVLARHLEATLDVAAAVLVPDPVDGLVAAAGLTPVAAQEITVARWAFDHREVAGHGTDTLSGTSALCVPLIAGDAAVGVLAIQRRRGTPPRLGVDQRQLIDALARQAALAIARVQFAEQAREAALRAHTEELRSSLLSAVSHDLRTPLSVITGAATSLVQHGDTLTPAARGELLQTIVEDARRLERVLSNLLQLTRVETGMQPAREWVPADEIVGAALTRTEETRRGRAVETDVESDLLLEIDPVLFEQVLINLIENATKHGAPPFTIRARRDGGDVVIEVADRGPGLPQGESARLFEKFVRASAAPGAGLGLAVVRAIVHAHGGTVIAANRPDGGAVFRVVLPTPPPPATPLTLPERAAS